jgi:Rod binding domain-containing protein
MSSIQSAMSSIQSKLLSQPLPLSDTASASPFVSKGTIPTPAQDPAKVAQDFESVFTSMMLKEMRNTLEPGSLFGEDSSDIYGGMFDQFLGQHMADSGGIGLARMIQKALDRHTTSTEKHTNAPTKIN